MPPSDAVPHQQVPELAPRLRIEARGGLVEKQQVRLAHQRAGQRQALLLPARELADPGAALLVELDELQHLVDRPAALAERAEEADGLLDRQLLGELRLLELDAEPLAQLAILPGAPALAEQLDLALVGRGQPFEDLDGRRLAGAVGAEQAEALAAADLEIEAVDGDDVAEALDQAATADRRGH